METKITSNEVINAKEIIARAKILAMSSIAILPFVVRWGSVEDEKAAFGIANKRKYVGSPNCRPCHIKAWIMLHVIVQESQPE